MPLDVVAESLPRLKGVQGHLLTCRSVRYEGGEEGENLNEQPLGTAAHLNQCRRCAETSAVAVLRPGFTSPRGYRSSCLAPDLLLKQRDAGGGLWQRSGCSWVGWLSQSKLSE